LPDIFGVAVADKGRVPVIMRRPSRDQLPDRGLTGYAGNLKAQQYWVRMGGEPIDSFADSVRLPDEFLLECCR